MRKTDTQMKGMTGKDIQIITQEEHITEESTEQKRNMTTDTKLIKTRITANYKSDTEEFYFTRDNDKLLQNYWTQIPRSSMLEVLWRR
ncbi:hypothetical protein H5410_064577 [Solanum commersonii]|uniref:Uncharacterized protein n=1 Tax=Solanum commersonii TaxID=4109 RepID=A0A9J5VZ09_SOLCO|nr:hypothetical protein H5410_064577 [Solanum commersonii]